MSLEADVRLTLAGFSLEANVTAVDGEVLVVAGPNGAGKSTLLRTLAGLDRLTGGRIAIDGDTIDDGTAFVPTHVRPDCDEIGRAHV